MGPIIWSGAPEQYISVGGNSHDNGENKLHADIAPGWMQTQNPNAEMQQCTEPLLGVPILMLLAEISNAREYF